MKDTYASTLGNELPPLRFDKKTRRNKKYREAVMDSFERIGLEQVRFNIENFDDFYRMYDGTLSHKELKMLAPQYEVMNDLLNKAELPPNVRHWDIIGGVINILVGKLIQMQDKFHVTDVGEPAESDLMEEYNKQLQSLLKEMIENKVKVGFAKAGLDPESLNKVESPEQQQQMLQMLEQERRKIVSQSSEKVANTAKFKTAGVIWGEATLEKDKEILDFDKQYQRLFKDFLLSGMCAKISKVIQDSYRTFVWDSRTIFHSKDIGREYLNDFGYAGRVHFQNPTQVLEEWGDYIDFKTQKSLLEGDDTWKQLSEIKNPTGSIQEVLRNNFHKEFQVPYTGYHNTLYYKRLEELTGLPMGEQIFIDSSGGTQKSRTWIPRNDRHSIYNWFAEYIENRFPLNSNICQVTEVYFRAMEPIGYLTYEDDNGEIHYGEIVTEDILPEFIKDKNIKQIKNLGFIDMVEKFEVNTIVWQMRPIVGWGVKIVPSNSLEPIYLGVEPMEHQVKGLSDVDVKLPVTGMVGVSLAKKVEGWQDMFNYCWNQVRQLVEKELGTFFLLAVENIPSDMASAGDTQEAVMMLRNMAKRTGMMPVEIDPEGVGSSPFNQFTPHSVSHAGEIDTRYKLAMIAKQELYSALGLNTAEGQQPTQYVTAEGVKVSQEAMQTQTAYIYEDFNKFMKVDLNQHLSIAQFVQSNNMDRSLYYTKSDLSINFIKVNDPKLPLRTLGIIATDDSRKRREVEMIKQALLQRNTMDMDAKELIQLTTSSSWRELMDIADQERQIRTEREELNHQRAMEQIDAQTQGQIQAEEKRWEREELTNQLDRKNKIDIKTIESIGRASDENANAEDFAYIEESRRTALQETKVSNDYETRMRELDMQAEDLQIKKKELLNSEYFKKRELDIKEKDIETKDKISIRNKN